ncbi:MAG: hypothetical protein K1X89_13420 [Myxococcaceae bacterium]|nr:hypothetical protein [Myxococcaceae bacterium]
MRSPLLALALTLVSACGPAAPATCKISLARPTGRRFDDGTVGVQGQSRDVVFTFQVATCATANDLSFRVQVTDPANQPVEASVAQATVKSGDARATVRFRPSVEGLHHVTLGVEPNVVILQTEDLAARDLRQREGVPLPLPRGTVCSAYAVLPSDGGTLCAAPGGETTLHRADRPPLRLSEEEANLSVAGDVAWLHDRSGLWSLTFPADGGVEKDSVGLASQRDGGLLGLSSGDVVNLKQTSVARFRAGVGPVGEVLLGQRPFAAAVSSDEATLLTASPQQLCVMDVPPTFRPPVCKSISTRVVGQSPGGLYLLGALGTVPQLSRLTARQALDAGPTGPVVALAVGWSAAPLPGGTAQVPVLSGPLAADDSGPRGVLVPRLEGALLALEVHAAPVGTTVLADEHFVYRFSPDAGAVAVPRGP